MSSIIPKIKIGLAAGKREKHNLSFDCSTTANIGTIQPTMCREMIPNSKFKVKVSSLVRLSSMPVPTFGRMSLRHYHCFIPYHDVYESFDAMMSGQHYRGGTQVFIPASVPKFNFSRDIMRYILMYSDISICEQYYHLDRPYTVTTTNVDWTGQVYQVGTGTGQFATMELAIKHAQEQDINRIKNAWSALSSSTNSIFGGYNTTDGKKFFIKGAGSLAEDDYGVVRMGSFYGKFSKDTTTDDIKIAYPGPGQDSCTVFIDDDNSGVITPEGADLITRCGSYAVLFKFKAPLKRLRQVFLGLGYPFSPYDTQDFSMLKLLAYYKAWFSIFSANRERTFTDTNCYQLIKLYSNSANPTTDGTSQLFDAFMVDLIKDCFYYLPMDYFSMAVKNPLQSNQDVNSIRLEAVPGNEHSRVTFTKTDTYTDNTLSMTTALSPLTIRLANRMLTWANKNTVIGRSIREYLKVHFGVTDTDSINDDGVVRIGASRTNIQISDVMSTAENSEGYLGEYAGKGIGYGDSETFDYTAKDFGVWITLTAVVPESGYYQGYLAENRHFDRFQFFNPEFDALGYQILERGELMDDYSYDTFDWNPRTSIYRNQAFGFIPRYSEYKVGRNICNGDLSLAGLKATMAPYTLDRRISSGVITKTYNDSADPTTISTAVEKPSYIPTIVEDKFRRIDPTDHLGQYNRIFNYTNNDLDHFIIHNLFDVVCFAPMKSLSESFNTVCGDDDGSIDVTHS